MPVTQSKESAKEILLRNAAKLKEEVTERHIASQRNELAMTEEVKKLFAANAQTGLENVSGSSLPYLKITEANSDNLLADGTRAPAGTFYYVPTQEVHESMRVVFLLISKGFYSAQENKKTGETDVKFQQIVGGMNLDTMEPFAMFASGTRWKPMMDFMKSLSVYTKDKQNPLPLFSLPVQMTLEEITTDFGRNHIVKYELFTDDVGRPTPITDIDQINMFLSGIEKFRESFEAFITATEVDKRTGQRLVRVAEAVDTENHSTDPEPSYGEDQYVPQDEQMPF